MIFTKLVGKGCGIVKQIGPGILTKSEIAFSSPSIKAKKLYYNVLSAGHFYCDKDYHLVRDNFDSILILYVINGIFTFVDNAKNHINAEKGDTVILDCYKPHEYYSNDALEFVWIHISGVNSREFCQAITESNGNLIKCKDSEHIKEMLFRLYKGIEIENSFTEAELSLEIYKLLLDLLNPLTATAKEDAIHKDDIQEVKEFIAVHLNEKITVKQLSDMTHMSQTHFSRVFKSQTGFSPYDYVLVSRLNKAKECLLKTDMSVAEIAYESGFNSEANFVYCFTNNEGISPGKFRKMKF